MMNKEEYNRELIRMLDSLRINEYKGRNNCNGVDCKECPLHGLKYGCSNALSSLEIYYAVEKWSKEHPPKKYQVSELEYYLLELCVFNHMNVLFGTSSIMCYLLRREYFKGANENMLISDYFENCEIEVEEDV